MDAALTNTTLIGARPRARQTAGSPWLLVVALVLAWPHAAGAAEASGGIEGRWRTDDGKGIVTIGHCGDALCGWITKVLATGHNVPKTDINNPDVRLRNKPIVGLTVLSGFRRWRNAWSGGRAYDPKTGNNYRARLGLNGDGSLRVTGCVFLFCKSVRWMRAS